MVAFSWFPILDGLARAMLLFLIASGLSIIFGLMGVVNFAHGAFYAIGAFTGITLLGYLDFSNAFFVVLLIAPLVALIIGVAVERYTIQPLYSEEPIYQVLLTFGITIVIEDALVLIFSRNQQMLPPPDLLAGATELPVIDTFYPTYRLFVIGLGLLVAVLLWLVISRTRIGIIIRAGTLDSEMVELQGINVRRLFTLMFGFGVALAALGGLAAGPIFSVQPQMGHSVLIDAFLVVILGGVGSIRGTFVGALGIGYIKSIGGFYLSEWVGIILFSLMIIFLLVRPYGMFGEPGVLEH